MKCSSYPSLSQSLPSSFVPLSRTEVVARPPERGIMRVRTLSESLNSITSSSSNQQYSHRIKRRNSCNAVPLSVGFNHVDVREYEVMIGDNPACSNGAPVSLDWGYSESCKDVPVDVFEKGRNGTRREREELKMPAFVRHSILMEKWDFSLVSIKRASQETDAVRKERLKTARKSIHFLRKRELLKSVFKPLKVIFKRLAIKRKEEKNERRIRKSSELISPRYIPSEETASSSFVEEGGGEELAHSRRHYNKTPGRVIQVSEHFVIPSTSLQ